MSATQYDLVVFGATGYTGKLTAEHITKSLPTDLRWALAGRTASRLEAVRDEIRTTNPDRIQPDIEICQLNDANLSNLAKKTKVLISTVGPYSIYGEHAYKACAENGTHYLDVTGEIPWTFDMIKKYEKIAKANGSIMISQIGLESAPSDLVAWSLVTMIREKFSAPTGEVVFSVHEFNAAPSGGTMNSVFTLLDTYGVKKLGESTVPYALSPIAGPKSTKPWFTRLFGVRVVPDLGTLTSSMGGPANEPIVQRSWGLLGGNSFYGPNFQFGEYSKARNFVTAVAFHFIFHAIALTFTIPIVRKLIRRLVYQPGDGPTKDATQKDRADYRGIAKADVQSSNPPRAYCRAYFNGSLYALTGILLAEAAISILRDEHDLSGGIYTPACLGQKYIDRLDSAGFKFEKKFYDN